MDAREPPWSTSSPASRHRSTNQSSGADAASIDATNVTDRLRQKPPDHGRLPTTRRDPSASAPQARAKRDESGTREPEPGTEHGAGNRELPPLSARALEALKLYRET